MKIEFANDVLARILTEKAHKMGLLFAVINATRNTLIKLESATIEQDLFAIGGLDYKIRKGENNDTRQVRVNKQYRILFTIAGKGSNLIATITFIGDPH